MSKLALPKLTLPQLRGITFEPSPEALLRWNAALAAKKDDKEEDEDNTISIYDVIGFDPWTGSGVTAKRIAAALRSIGPKKNVVVNINSPGGDVFEGIAIYNLLRDHEGDVTTRVIGLAASAASVIAMAGDRIQTARTGFMMMHNVWVIAIGNRNDLRDAADQLETFDDALAGVYASRSGQDKKAVAKMMDKETWMSGEQAIEKGFADELLPADAVEEKQREAGTPAAALRDIDIALAKRGMPRSERRALINTIKERVGAQVAADPQQHQPQHQDTQDAVLKGTQDAAEVEAKAQRHLETFRQAAQS
jgi:ATP-dependent Clp endopeptidase proteolytic subunit ClpP